MNDIKYLEIARDEAQKSLEASGVPVGACLVDTAEKVRARGHNERVQTENPIAHGEMTVLRKAGRLMCYEGTTLYTTLSPCVMCRGAIKLFGIPRVVVGEAETFKGDLDDLRASGTKVTLIDDEACKKLMRDFQKNYPEIWREDIGVSSTPVENREA